MLHPCKCGFLTHRFFALQHFFAIQSTLRRLKNLFYDICSEIPQERLHYVATKFSLCQHFLIDNIFLSITFFTSFLSPSLFWQVRMHPLTAFKRTVLRWFLTFTFFAIYMKALISLRPKLKFYMEQTYRVALNNITFVALH